MSYIDKIKKGSDTYDIQDARIPAATSTDADKVIKVSSTGAYELGTAGGGASVEDITSTLTFDSTIPNTSKVSKYGNVVHISLMLGDFSSQFDTTVSDTPKTIISGLPIPKNKGAYSAMLSQLGAQDSNALIFPITPPQNAGSDQYMDYAIIDTSGNFKILATKSNLTFGLDEITYICE